jgi:mono/diheme cytochrome c family protein
MNKPSSFVTIVAASWAIWACIENPSSSEDAIRAGSVSTGTYDPQTVPVLVAATPAAAKPGAAHAVTKPVAKPADEAAQRAAEIKRGEHLVLTSACNDCHTPFKMGPQGPEPDMSRMLSGHPEDAKVPPPPAAQGPWIAAIYATNTAWAGPWGVSFTANLTPDDTGLGKWTFENFKQAIRTGRHMGRGRPILPPMPYPMYRNFTDEEFSAIYAYLRSIPAVKNRVPDPLPPAGTPGAAPGAPAAG